ncbi:MAG: ribonuclease HII [Anaerovoracaceae bacterium]|nr:ribonuclease HII [Anaerovoracaceae bacterium]
MTKAEREALLMEKLAEKKAFDDAFRSSGADDCDDENDGCGAKYIAGVDEVGRGPLAGPVVAACVVLPEDFDVPGVDDSKKLSEKKREALYDEIMSRALAVGIGRADNLVIDEINILQATKEAMKEAVAAADQMLRQRLGADEGSDGSAAISHILFDAMTIQEIDIPQTSIIKGDAKSLSIGAASIVAKVTRDREMAEYHKIYPDYGFDSNKGYGTKAHYEGIRRCGITPIHRKSFLKNVL